jgi:hypothetical protein
MGLAEQALREGDLARAEALYGCALALVEQAMWQGNPDRARDCVVALVSSCRCLSDLHSDRAHAQGAAAALAQAHNTLIHLLVQHPKGSAWHEAAAWHSRETHNCLVEHWQEHGPDPLIEGAMRRACVHLHASNACLH